MLPKNILVPTDLSPGADEAVDFACELAAKLGATVHFLNVISIPALGVPELGLAVAATVIDDVVAENKRALDALVDSHRTQIGVGSVLLETGDARDTINRVATELGADLIVMGTHGRRGVKRALLGSVAETVVRSAPCPVLTVRAHLGERSDRDAA